MRREFQPSLEIDFDTPSFQALPEMAAADFGYLDQLIESLSQLIRDTTWPESDQGEFLDYVTRDVYEFSCAIRAEAGSGRWTVAVSLLRPLHERSEYALAAALDSSFRRKHEDYMNTQIEKKFKGRPKTLVEIARGTIARWAKESHGEDGLLETSKGLNKIGSELLHHAIGLSGEAEEIARIRPGLLRMAGGRVQLAMANVLLAIQVMGAGETKAWRQASVIVIPP